MSIKVLYLPQSSLPPQNKFLSAPLQITNVTDRRATYDPKTALCTKVQCAVKKVCISHCRKWMVRGGNEEGKDMTKMEGKGREGRRGCRSQNLTFIVADSPLV